MSLNIPAEIIGHIAGYCPDIVCTSMSIAEDCLIYGPENISLPGTIISRLLEDQTIDSERLLYCTRETESFNMVSKHCLGVDRNTVIKESILRGCYHVLRFLVTIDDDLSILSKVTNDAYRKTKYTEIPFRSVKWITISVSDGLYGLEKYREYIKWHKTRRSYRLDDAPINAPDEIILEFLTHTKIDTYSIVVTRLMRARHHLIPKILMLMKERGHIRRCLVDRVLQAIPKELRESYNKDYPELIKEFWEADQ